MEETPVPIHVAMSRVMADMKAIAKKNQNTQQNYAFRGIDDVFNELQPVLVKHGVWYTPIDVTTNYEWRQTRAGGWQHSATLTVTYRFTGPAGDFVDSKVPGESADPADKSTGQAMSQALKTLLLQTFCIRTQESAKNDPDSKSPEDGGPPPTHVSLKKYVAEKLTEEQWAVLKEEWRENYDFSLFGVPIEREQEMRQLIDKFAAADAATGEVQSAEPNPQERSDEGAGEINLPAYERPMKESEAKEKLTSALGQYIRSVQDARHEAKEIWTESGYDGMGEIGAVEWGVLMSFARDRILEMKAAS